MLSAAGKERFWLYGGQCIINFPAIFCAGTSCRFQLNLMVVILQIHFKDLDCVKTFSQSVPDDVSYTAKLPVMYIVHLN